jgi:hypothetical protein
MWNRSALKQAKDDIRNKLPKNAVKQLRAYYDAVQKSPLQSPLIESQVDGWKDYLPTIWKTIEILGTAQRNIPEKLAAREFDKVYAPYRLQAEQNIASLESTLERLDAFIKQLAMERKRIA